MNETKSLLKPVLFSDQTNTNLTSLVNHFSKLNLTVQKTANLEDVKHIMQDQDNHDFLLFFDIDNKAVSIKDFYNTLGDQHKSANPIYTVLIGKNMVSSDVKSFLDLSGNEYWSMPFDNNEWFELKLRITRDNLVNLKHLRRIQKSLRHDLRSPVGVIQTGVEILQSNMVEPPLAKEHSEIVVRLHRSCEKFFRTIDDLG